ncbi:MAG: hypothetical protein JW733_01085, partial [Coriobacteriia bacterium]|nr:hypothetical protein [Coriobacteriia bacterium]MBN2847966.1 hypothetical protein [Coriobacteriia bacterium]
MNRHPQLGAWVTGSEWRNRLIVFGRFSFLSHGAGAASGRTARKGFFRHGSAEEEVAIRMR